MYIIRILSVGGCMMITFCKLATSWPVFPFNSIMEVNPFCPRYVLLYLENASYKDKLGEEHLFDELVLYDVASEEEVRAGMVSIP